MARQALQAGSLGTQGTQTGVCLLWQAPLLQFCSRLASFQLMLQSLRIELPCLMLGM